MAKQTSTRVRWKAMTTVRYFWHYFILGQSRTFMFLQYSRPPYFHLLQSFWKATYVVSASKFVGVLHWPPSTTDNLISYVVPDPSQWCFHLGEEIAIVQRSGEDDDTWWYRTLSFFMAMQDVTPLLLSRTFCAAGNGRFWNIHLTRPIWIYTITIFSPKWKNHCEEPGVAQEMSLSVL